MSEYGLMLGRYPAIVRGYDPARRTCRIEIPGLTDGGDVLPEAEIEYPIGDKSAQGQFASEIEVLQGDTVWISYIGGDPRYPIITGWRNPQSGNSVGWRRWHHSNVEVASNDRILLDAGSELTGKAGVRIALQAPKLDAQLEQVAIAASGGVTVSTPAMTIEGDLHVTGQATFGGTSPGTGGGGGGGGEIDGGNW